MEIPRRRITLLKEPKLFFCGENSGWRPLSEVKGQQNVVGGFSICRNCPENRSDKSPPPKL